MDREKATESEEEAEKINMRIPINFVFQTYYYFIYGLLIVCVCVQFDLYRIHTLQSTHSYTRLPFSLPSSSVDFGNRGGHKNSNRWKE